MTGNRRVGCVLCGGAMVVVSAGVALAGDLNPPAGPVQPTVKTLDEVEPRIPIKSTTAPGDANSLFKITQPGSYYLIGDVVGVNGKHGIEIGVNDVTIDLRGFRIRGIPGSLSGISTDGSVLKGVTVRNGVVREWAGDGLLIAGSGHRLEGMTALNNVGRGLGVATNSLFVRCIAIENGGDGLFSTDHCSFLDCIALDNGGNGIKGNVWCKVSECLARLNSQAGIAITSGSVHDCSASSNTGTGIDVQNEGVVVGCDSSDNSGNGIEVGLGSNVSACVSKSNDAVGISAMGGSTIWGCASSANRTDGIQVTDDCLVRDNVCDGNGNVLFGAGIHVVGLDCRIDGNVMNDADRGLQVDSIGSFIVRNTAEGNATNYQIAAGNVVGVIVLGTVSGAINGSTGGAGVGTTNPWANFSH